MSNVRILQERRTPAYKPSVDTCRETAEKFLTELASDGIGGNRSAHWWVGCLSSQLEYFLAATDPERAK